MGNGSPRIPLETQACSTLGGVVDVEGESAEVAQRSLELAELLDAGHPTVDRSEIAGVLAESRRLARETHRARGAVAARWIAGVDAGVPIGHQPPIRRIRTDARGRDTDPLGGRAAVTPELIAYWEHRRDVVSPATEGMYRAAAERTPYREALVAASHGHISLLRERHSMLSEGGDELEAALGRYDQAYVNIRQGAIDTQGIAGEAQERLDSLAREKAKSMLGDGDEVKGFIGAVLGTMSDLPIDAKTELPIVPAPEVRTGEHQRNRSWRSAPVAETAPSGEHQRNPSWRYQAKSRAVDPAEWGGLQIR
jgi:hypothetical protein